MRAKEWSLQQTDFGNGWTPERAERYAAHVVGPLVEALKLPDELERQYDSSLEKALSGGALKTLKNAEAAIGAWYMKSYRITSIAAALATALAALPELEKK